MDSREIEMAERNVLVSLLVRLSRLVGMVPLETPHLFGGGDRQKLEWEYGAAPLFLSQAVPFVSPRFLQGKDVLDVGCGWGGKAVFYAENCGVRTITGFDLPGRFRLEATRAFAEDRGVGDRCSFFAASAEEIPFPKSSFDVIITEDVLEHVGSPEKVIAECWRVLRPGGTIVAKFPSFRMILAHHLDRALTLPAAHYLLSMKAWARGLNYLRIADPQRYRFEGFEPVVATAFHPCITRNLNGIDFNAFSRIMSSSRFRIDTLRCVRPAPNDGPVLLLRKFLHFLQANGVLNEFMAHYILCVATKEA